MANHFLIGRGVAAGVGLLWRVSQFMLAVEQPFDNPRRMASGEIRIPRGVYRFKTFEDADEWWDKIIACSEPGKDSPKA